MFFWLHALEVIISMHRACPSICRKTTCNRGACHASGPAAWSTRHAAIFPNPPQDCAHPIPAHGPLSALSKSNLSSSSGCGGVEGRVPAWTKEEGAPLSDAGILDALTSGEWAKIAEMAKIPASACLAVCLQARTKQRALPFGQQLHIYFKSKLR